MRAVRSALDQTLSDLEVVVVVDGNDPITVRQLEQIKDQDSRVRIAALKQRVGGADARNHGVNIATGEWVAFLDDDDEWLPEKLQAQLEAVMASTATAAIGTCKIIARTPRKDYVWPRRTPEEGEPISEYLLARRSLSRGEGSVQTSTFFVSRSLMLDQPFKSGQLKHQDTEWLLRAGSMPGAQIVFADQVLAIHYVEEERGSVSSKANWRYSLAWLRNDRHLFTRKALTGFVFHHVAPEAAEEGDYAAVPILLWEALRFGSSTFRDLAIFAAMWLLPRSRRRQLRDWMTRKPILNSLVFSR